jgi:hypothetical protein
MKDRPGEAIAYEPDAKLLLPRRQTDIVVI